MKSERRHELETNDLADWLGHASEKLQPHFKTILAVVLLAIIVLVGRSMLATSSQRQEEESWSAFFASRKLEAAALRDVATQYPRSKAAPWALLVAGQNGLQDGLSKLIADRDKSKELLEQSASDFRLAISKAKDDEVKKRAMFGLAQVYETLGDFEQAKAEYEKVISMWPDDSVSEFARRRAEFASRSDTVAFVDWLKQQKVPDPTNPPSPSAPSIEVKPPESSVLDEAKAEETTTPPDVPSEEAENSP
jgi:tetratricopeptide (TPR) repeat protein